MAVATRRLPRLITIPFSHYCERARWALDAAGIAYEEESSAPLLHMVNVALAPGKGKGAADKASSSLSTPLLVLPSGERLHDSGVIARWAADHAEEGSVPLFPEALRSEIDSVEARLHDGVGRSARSMAYWAIRSPDLFYAVTVPMLPPSQRAVGTLIMSTIKPLIFRSLGITEKRAHRSAAKLEEEFAWASGLLETRKYLAGDVFTAADATLASLAAPVLLVTAAEGNIAVPSYPTVDRIDPAWRDAVLRLRATPAGQHVLRMYRDHRPALKRAAEIDRPELLLGGAALLVGGAALFITAVVWAVSLLVRPSLL